MHLSRQMKEGKRPRIFKHGEQKRDFVYVKDIVQGTLRALEAKESGIYNLGSGQARSFNELIADSEPFVRHELRSRNTSITRTRITRTTPRPI